MTSELDTLLLEFQEWTDRLREWDSHINHNQLSDETAALEAQGMSPEQAMLQALSHPRLPDTNHPDVKPYIRRLCQYFVKAIPEERGKIYQAFEGNMMMLEELAGFFRYAITQFQSTKNIAFLNYALVGIAIEDGRGVDYRDSILALDKMIEAAKGFKIDYKTSITKILAIMASTPHIRTKFPNSTEYLSRRK